VHSGASAAIARQAEAMGGAKGQVVEDICATGRSRPAAVAGADAWSGVATSLSAVVGKAQALEVNPVPGR